MDSPQSRTSQPTDALATLAANGKTFYWASLFLGRTRAVAAARLYQCCRILDDIADDTESSAALKRSRLEHIKHSITVSHQPSQDALITEWQHLISEYGVDGRAVEALIDGLIEDTEPVLLMEQRNLERYCYRVAGTVGLMMCPLLGVTSRQALAHAIDLGMAMQLTNVCRDVLEDAHMGRRYLPVGIAPASLADPGEAERAAVAKEIDRQLHHAERLYQSGIQGLSYLPRGSRISIYLAAALYRAIGRKLQNTQIQWWRGRTVIPLTTKCLLSLKSVPSLIALVLRPAPIVALHQADLHKHIGDLPHADA
ncbi:MAG: phytoene/squalene synthase family protein [Pseudomonadales bacterium]|jgi:15-cis-phytoene synthase|nr:phytoene/squalene synthase family protein [Pseudomonadales bacterium]MDP4640700.1 phytoene/squalene synthase family protein [Pseudomonadales bacterium]MDP5059946.1 phytoene/squalene synthase family protein [Pseudomonadales bacterium]